MSDVTFFSILGGIVVIWLARRYLIPVFNPYRLSTTYSDAWAQLRWPYQKRIFKRRFALGVVNEITVRPTKRVFRFLRDAPDNKTVFCRGELNTWTMHYFTPEGAINTARIKEKHLFSSKEQFEQFLALFPFSKREDAMLCMCKLMGVGMWGEVDLTTTMNEHKGVGKYASIYVVIDIEDSVAYRLNYSKWDASLEAVDLDGETEPALPTLRYEY